MPIHIRKAWKRDSMRSTPLWSSHTEGEYERWGYKSPLCKFHTETMPYMRICPYAVQKYMANGRLPWRMRKKTPIQKFCTKNWEKVLQKFCTSYMILITIVWKKKLTKIQEPRWISCTALVQNEYTKLTPHSKNHKKETKKEREKKKSGMKNKGRKWRGHWRQWGVD